MVVTSDIQKQILLIRKKAKEALEKKQAIESERLKKINEVSFGPGVIVRETLLESVILSFIFVRIRKKRHRMKGLLKKTALPHKRRKRRYGNCL